MFIGSRGSGAVTEDVEGKGEEGTGGDRGDRGGRGIGGGDGVPDSL